MCCMQDLLEPRASQELLGLLDNQDLQATQDIPVLQEGLVILVSQVIQEPLAIQVERICYLILQIISNKRPTDFMRKTFGLFYIYVLMF